MRLYLLVLISVLFSASCAKFDASKARAIKVYGHAGSGLKPEQYNFPPNSLSSIKKAIMADAADGVEVDVQMSRDSVIYLFHDQKLEGNTNGIGLIHEHFSFEIDELIYRKSFLGIEKEGILSLPKLIEWMNTNEVDAGLSINVQRQPIEGDQQTFNLDFIQKILEETSKLKTSSEVYIESPYEDQLDFLVAGNLSDKIMWDTDLTPDAIRYALHKGYHGIVSSYSQTSKEYVQMARDSGLMSVLFGLRIYPNIREAFDLAPDIVQTDNVPLTLSLRDE